MYLKPIDWFGFLAQMGNVSQLGNVSHLMGDSKSCIDLIFSGPPSLIIESGVHPSLPELCHHQIVHGKLSVLNITLPPHTHRICYYDKADFFAIMKSIGMYRWQEHLDKITCPNEQVRLLNKVLLNIYTDYSLNQVKAIKPREAPWITHNVRKIPQEKESCL